MSVIVDSREGAEVHLDLIECYFVGVQDLRTMDGVEKGGHDAIAATGPSQVRLTQCALAPHAVVFHLAEGTRGQERR